MLGSREEGAIRMSNDPVRLTPRIASYQLALLSVLEAADLIVAANGNEPAAKPRGAAADAETGDRWLTVR